MNLEMYITISILRVKSSEKYKAVEIIKGV